ncbi:MAG: protein kinase [Candidatus Aureabacteria bacterium]|nr:protein kinase [Candidatus Auribacterota bacterium]
MIEKVGKYNVIKELSRGGMGVVYLGMHPTLDRKVAIKMLPKELVSNKEFIQRFEREAKIIATLDNPNIVYVYDYEEAMETYFIIMEFIDGKMLSEFIKKDKPMPNEQVSAIMTQLVGALSYAHKNGIVHRDIKPGNAMMRDDGVVKLMDFGISFSETSDVHLTQEGKVIGTPKYMSPEQLQGKRLDSRSDIYSLGVMCYEMLAGHPPFDGKDFITIAAKHLREEAVPIRSVVPDITPELENFIERSLIKDREKRLASLAEISFAGEKNEKTIYMEAIQKKGISKKFFYIVLIIMIAMTGLFIVGGHLKNLRKEEDVFKDVANKKIKGFILEAKKLFKKKDYKECLQYLLKAQLIDPLNTVVNKNIDLTRKKLAEKAKKKILKLEKKAKADYDQERIMDAVAIWKEILFWDDSRKDIQKKVKLAEKRLNKEQNRIEAQKHLSKAAELEETHGDYEAAEKEYLIACKLDPENSEPLYLLGLLYARMFTEAENREKERPKAKKAIEFLLKAYKISPEDKGILKHLAFAFLDDGKKGKALEFAEKLKIVDEEEGSNTIDVINQY